MIHPSLSTQDVKLIDFDKKSRLGKDLAKYSSKYKEEPIIYLEVSFPEAYPMAPPFLRVTKPRFQFLTGKALQNECLVSGLLLV